LASKDHLGVIGSTLSRLWERFQFRGESAGDANLFR